MIDGWQGEGLRPAAADGRGPGRSSRRRGGSCRDVLLRGGFTDSVPVTVVSPRAGLVMNPDAKVQIRGVQVGKVESIESLPNGEAAIHLAMDPSRLHAIPANRAGRYRIDDGVRRQVRPVGFSTGSVGGMLRAGRCFLPSTSWWRSTPSSSNSTSVLSTYRARETQ